MKEKYWGSVRFFKNLILLIVIIAIAVPSSLAAYYSGQLKRTEDTMEAKENEERSRLEEEARQENESSEEEQESSEEESESSEENESEEESKEPITMAAPAYQALYPDFYAPQEYGAMQERAKTIFLTFDDGPSPQTDRLLDILAEEGVKATFFVVHVNGDAAKERMRRIVNEGHTLAMHSYTHQYKKIYASVEAYLDDMYQLFCEIKEVTGVTPSLFRFPGGSINSYNGGVYQEIIAEMIRRGFVPHDWNISSQDAVNPSRPSEDILNSVVEASLKVSRGVVLMHDSTYRGTTIDAVRFIIQQLREQGYALDRLLPEDKPYLFSYKF